MKFIKTIAWLSLLIGIASLFVLFSGNVSAWNSNSFNDSSTGTNLTFTGNQNITRWLSVPNTVSFLINARLNITGKNYSSSQTQVIGMYNYTTQPAQDNISYQWDNNWDTYSRNTTGNEDQDSYANFSVPIDIRNNLNNSNASIIVKFYNDHGCVADHNWDFAIYNFQTSGWDGSVQYGGNKGIIRIANHSFTLNEQRINNNNISIRVRSFSLCAGNGGIDIRFYEMNASFSYLSYPNNLSLGINNNQIFNHTNAYAGRNKTANFRNLINNHLNSTYLVGSNYIMPFVFHSDSHGILEYFDLQFDNMGFIEHSQSYNSSTNSGALATFRINMSYDNVYYTSTSASFIYNNTVYTTSKSGTGNNYLYSSIITVPQVLLQTNKSFYWQFVLTNSSGTAEYYNSTFNNQTINTVLFDNCTTYANNLFNFTLYDEDERTQLNGTIESIINLYTYGTSNLINSFNQSFNFIANAGNARICSEAINNTYSMDYQVRYYGNTSSYTIEYKHGQGITVSNNTAVQQVNLYSLLTSRATVFTIYVQGSDLSDLDNAVVDIQRQYVPINQFISVESPLTDSNGNAIAHLLVGDVYYNFVISRNGVLLGTFSNKRVKCTDATIGNCPINLNLIQATSLLDDYKNLGNISVNFDFNKGARSLAMDYLSTDGLSHTIKWNVVKRDNYGNNTYCTNTNSGTSGTFTCNIPFSYGNSSIYAEVYSDGGLVGRSYYSLEPDSVNIFGGVRVLLGLLMYSTLTLMMTFHPIAIVVGSLLGMGFASAFFLIDGGTLFGTSAIFIWFIIAGAIIIIKLSKMGG